MIHRNLINFHLIISYLIFSLKAHINPQFNKVKGLNQPKQYQSFLSTTLNPTTILTRQLVQPSLTPPTSSPRPIPSPNDPLWAVSLSSMITPSPTLTPVPSFSDPNWAVSLSNVFPTSPGDVMWATEGWDRFKSQ